MTGGHSSILPPPIGLNEGGFAGHDSSLEKDAIQKMLGFDSRYGSRLKLPKRIRDRRPQHSSGGRLLRRLGFESLESRWLLATFTDNSPTLNLVLATNDQVAIASTGTAYTLTLASDTWTGTNGANVSGNGTSTLTVTSAGLAAFTTGITITDTGSAGGDSVTFVDSQASAYFNNFHLTLTNSAATGLAFNGTSAFASTVSLTAAVNGNVTINSGATVNLLSGALTLESTGTNTSLTASGNIVTQGGPVTLQATGNVTVRHGNIINSGSGNLTLAADVTAAGAGDDGVGTLAISSGATVVTTGTITLRGATESVDTSSNPAVVGASRSLATAPAPSIPRHILARSPGLRLKR